MSKHVKVCQRPKLHVTTEIILDIHTSPTDNG